ncbi:MAG: hypothetical protein AB1806_15785 [Acidobacteriota bacterium]
MKPMTTSMAWAVLVLTVAVSVGAAAQAPADLTGTWIGMTLVPNVGEDAITLDLKREADTYTGTCADAAGMIVGTEIKNVSYKEGTLTFDIGVSDGTASFLVRISLKVDGDTMAGTWTTEQGESGELKLARKVG